MNCFLFRSPPLSIEPEPASPKGALALESSVMGILQINTNIRWWFRRLPNSLQHAMIP
jgi:hypothetical protein